MRSHAGSTTSAPRERRDQVDVDDAAAAAAAAGWPLAGHGKALSPDWSAAGEAGPVTDESSRSFETLALEVEELVERQPQFAFLKPCRQLEQHYANKRNAAAGNNSSSNNSSFRHGHSSGSAASEATASTDETGVVHDEAGGVSSSDAQQKPGSSTMRDLLSCDGIELNSFLEGKSDRAQGASSATTTMHPEASPRWSVSERRPHPRGHFHRNSGERIWRISSTRCSIHEKEAHVDLVVPASAKFLVEMSPGAKQAHASPPAVAVPFKWEDAPGRAKAHAAAATYPTLQLPPRLAAPLQRSSENFSRQLRVSVISHPLAGFFPCMGAASPSPSPSPSRPPQPQDLAWMHYRASKSYGGVYQEPALPKPGADRRKPNKSFSQPLTQSTDLKPQPQPRRLFSSELGRYGGAAFSDPTTSSSSSSSILHGSRQSSSLRTYLSCELDASTPRTAGSKSSSSASYESIGEDFDQDDSSASPRSYAHHKPAPHRRRPGPGHNAHRRSESKGLLNLCKTHGHCLGKQPKSSRTPRGHHHHHHHPEVWAPTLATYFQRLDVTDVTDELLDKPAAAPTSSGYLNSKGEPVPLQQFTAEGSSPSPSPEVSPKRPTRLPYKMPSVAEQERGRHQRHASAKSLDLCPSPAYTAALEMLSPAAAVTLMASRRHQYRGSRPLPSSKPHRRVQFILSMCKTLKRVLFRQQARRSVIGTRLMYHDERHAPTTFQFSKPN